MSGISFVVDERGKRTAAVIDLRKHARIWEDFFDVLLTELRANEPRETFDQVRRRLKPKKSRNG